MLSPDTSEILLVGSLTSPYVRKLRLLFIAKRWDYSFQSINYLTPDDSAYLKSINPINKIPVLILKEKGNIKQSIFDSRVIHRYLVERFGETPLTYQEENVLSLIDGLLDSSINLFSLERAGLDTKSGKNSYLVRQWERIPLILKGLEPWVQEQKRKKNWDFLNMSLYSYLDWANFRGILDLSQFTIFTEYKETFSHEPGIAETEIPKI